MHEASAKWLAENGLWYLNGGRSVLHDVGIASVPKLGRKPYEDREIKPMVRIAAQSKNGLRDRAMLLIMLGDPSRSGEIRTLLLRDFVPIGPGDACGHVVIRHSKTEDGLRILPLDPEAEAAIQRYVSYGRPKYTGQGDAPLFLTDDGKAGLSAHGMSALRGRIKQRAAAEGIQGFMFHRARGYAT